MSVKQKTIRNSVRARRDQEISSNRLGAKEALRQAASFFEATSLETEDDEIDGLLSQLDVEPAPRPLR